MASSNHTPIKFNQASSVTCALALYPPIPVLFKKPDGTSGVVLTVITWVSIAMTDDDTCTDAFEGDEMEIKGSIRVNIYNLSRSLQLKVPAYFNYLNSLASLWPMNMICRNYKDNALSSNVYDESETIDEDLHRFSTSFMNIELSDEWDTLEEDSKYFDSSNPNEIKPFLVKYTPPESSKTKIEDIKPTGWNECDHKILYPKELFGYTLNPQELEEMEALLKKQGQLHESQIIYQDDLGNIRMTPKDEDLLDSFLSDSVESINFALMNEGS
ncbi:Pectinesterase inhibitor [Cynara cardunculus var. scolymus]|uniref:Pectinesterase inhibitor n=1 Tax=Cynara cardunculus var. scolymus TaxID=59895 RepID=A0A103Y8N0_CYNCS|nr:Pectinesterase inhibitor [Cynara cardunculus var. scolymus]